MHVLSLFPSTKPKALASLLLTCLATPGKGTGKESQSLMDRGNFQKSNSIADDLASLGLTLSQAKLYLFFLSYGASPARAASKELGLHRVDVYRKLHELQELGLVEQHIASPKRYVAVSPGQAIRAILTRQRENEALLKQRADFLLPKLNLLRTHQTQNGDNLAGPLYRLGIGRTRYHNEMVALVRAAKHEVLRMLSSDSLIRNFQTGFYREYARAASRGISIRMITEVTPANRNMVRRLSKVIKVRQLDEVKLRFAVIDKSVTVFGTSYKPGFKEYEDNSYIVLKDPNFAIAFCSFFDHLWVVANEKP